MLRRAIILLAVVAVSVALVLAPLSGQVPSDFVVQQGGQIITQVEGPRSEILRMEAADPLASAVGVQPYAFFPQGGTLWQDLYVNNYVDVGVGVPRDYDCGDYTYPGHTGHDVDLPGFREQEIGVPVFAALDGTVVATHDGEADTNTAIGGQPANYVGISHGNGHVTWYYHLKRWSVAVQPDQVVVAGTQLGLTASSGSSTWPHLHFESQLLGVPYEPSSGQCRSGGSNWVNQVPTLHQAIVRSMTFSTSSFTGPAALPFDDVARSGTFLVGTQTVFVRFQLASVPVQSTYRLAIVRPDGAVVGQVTGSYNNAQVVRDAWWWYQFNVNLNVVGDWTFQIFVNDAIVATAPFRVLSSASESGNRPPFAVNAFLDPAAPVASDVPFCRVQTSRYYRDPDYDVIRYRYVWRVNGVVVRDVVSAGLADAVPRGTVAAGDSLTCLVTPRDDSVDGPSAQAESVATNRLAVGLGPFGGSGGWLTVRNGTSGGTDIGLWARLPWAAYNSLGGGVHLAAGDVDGDGLDEIVAGVGPNGNGWMAVFDDGAHGHALMQWIQVAWAGYNDANGEVWPAVGDLDGDGRAEIVAGLGSGGSGWVEIFDDAAAGFGHIAWRQVAWPSYNQFADGSTHPAIANVDGIGASEIVIGLGTGSNGWFEIVNGSSAGYSHRTWQQVQWPAYNAAQGTTFPAAGDLDGDGRAEVVVGLSQGGDGFIEIFDDAHTGFAHTRWLRTSWAAYNVGSSGETHPAVGNIDGDARAEIVVGLDVMPGFGGWFETFDDQVYGHPTLGWRNVDWLAFRVAGGATFPAIGRFR